MNDKMICTEVTISFDDYNMLLGKIKNLEARLAEVEKELSKQKDSRFLLIMESRELQNQFAASQTKLLDEKASRKNWQYMCEVAMAELTIARNVVEAARESLMGVKSIDNFRARVNLGAALSAYDAALGGRESKQFLATLTIEF